MSLSDFPSTAIFLKSRFYVNRVSNNNFTIVQFLILIFFNLLLPIYFYSVIQINLFKQTCNLFFTYTPSINSITISFYRNSFSFINTRFATNHGNHCIHMAERYIDIKNVTKMTIFYLHMWSLNYQSLSLLSFLSAADTQKHIF